MSDIVLRDVEKYFGDNYIIRKLNLEIRAREFVVLLGPSGCGKTTTLRAIAGLEDIDSGDILIDGKAVQNLKAADRDIAFVFQLFALYPHLTAYENIAFPLRAMNESKAVVDQRVREVAKTLRIDQLLQKRPSALSGGDMQRVAIGRALVRRPKALLMDEPIGALDAKLREEMRTELKHIHLQNEATTVYVTHDQVEAMAMADKIAIMNEGVLQQVGTPSAVYHHPQNLFVAQFIGSPKMNILPIDLIAESLPGRPDRSSHVGMRPEDLELTDPGSGLVSGRVLLSEYTGASSLLHVELPGGEIFLVAYDGQTIDADTALGLTIAPDRLHFFDAAGRRVN